MAEYQADNRKYVLQLKNIHKSFPGVKALDGVNLNAEAGHVHVICGENGAGKSTLMKVINGDYIPEEGEIIYKGEKLGKRTKLETLQMGIAMIQQELHPAQNLSIAENIYLGREPEKREGIVDFRKMYEDARVLMDQLKIPFDVRTPMGEVSIACQQMVEIAKAISRNSSVIIMDEPTSAISDTEVEQLFMQIERLKKQGVAVIYITHKMDEIFRIADEITVIRDGKWIATEPVEYYDIDKLISMMVGRDVSNIYPKTNVPTEEVILKVQNFTKEGGMFRNISFDLKKGEILGFSGLVGAGRSEVMRAVFGLDPKDSGEIFLEGKKVEIQSAEDAIQNGIGMIVEDRRAEGIVGLRSVRENMTNVSMKTNKFCRGEQIINRTDEKNEVNRMIELLDIMTPTMEQEIGNLSGGNQQKVIFARWMLLDNMKVLILDEPTRGIDVGAKAEIHRIMCELASKGLGIIMISSELPEVLGMSDRVVVMKEGSISGVLSRKEANEQSIMKLATM